MCCIVSGPEQAAVLQVASNATVVVCGYTFVELCRGLHLGTSASVTQAAAHMNSLQVTETLKVICQGILNRKTI